MGEGRGENTEGKGSRAPLVSSQTGQERGGRNCDVRDTGL